jgi:hypothetical protein
VCVCHLLIPASTPALSIADCNFRGSKEGSCVLFKSAVCVYVCGANAGCHMRVETEERAIDSGGCTRPFKYRTRQFCVRTVSTWHTIPVGIIHKRIMTLINTLSGYTNVIRVIRSEVMDEACSTLGGIWEMWGNKLVLENERKSHFGGYRSRRKDNIYILL